jgi:hypothetical protein
MSVVGASRDAPGEKEFVAERFFCGIGGGARGFSKLCSWFGGKRGLIGGLINGGLTRGDGPGVVWPG